MKTNREYQEKVEQRLGKPLIDIMHELIVDWYEPMEWFFQLGVPKGMFVTKRTSLSPDQRRADYAEHIKVS